MGDIVQANDQGLKVADDQGVIKTSLYPYIIDDFEDQDLSEYTALTGSLSDWGFDNSTVINGNYSLTITESTKVDRAIVSTSGLDNYPSAGDIISIWMHPSADGGNNPAANFYFGYQDANNYYMLTHQNTDSNDGIFRLAKADAGDFVTLHSETYNASNQWYRYEIDWGSSGTIDVTLYDSDGTTQLTNFSVTDTTFTDGGIGWFANFEASNTITFYFDYAIIKG